jgi:hypothetical protein
VDPSPQVARDTGPPPDRLHEDFALQGIVDPDAPVRASGEVVIEAPAARVWSVLADVRGWPAIRGDIHDVVASGPAAPGATFTWATDGNHLTSRFGIVEPGRRLTWTTYAPGVAAVHRYEVTPEGADRTRVWAEESMVVPEFIGLDADGLATRIATWLAGIGAVAAPTRP